MLLRLRRYLVACFSLLGLLAPLILHSHSAGPPPAYTGGYREPTCTYCHAGEANPASGSVRITGPALYTAGQRFTISVDIHDNASGRLRWSFELSVRFANGKQAGRFVEQSGLSFVTVPDTGVQYVTAQKAVDRPGTSYAFTVDWIAPADLLSGDVTFSVAAMASDGSGTTAGDHVFTSQSTSRPAITPSINPGGIVNAGSFGDANVAAPGSLISIFGRNLAPAAAAAGVVPLPTQLSGARVLIGGVLARLLFVSPLQINAQVPFVRAGQNVNVIVELSPTLSSPETPLLVDSFAPSFFTADGTGKGAVAALDADFRLLNDDSPAQPGEFVLLYCNGLGQTLLPLLEEGQAGVGQRTQETPTLAIGGLEAKVDYAGAAPGYVALYQVNAIVPDLPSGTYEIVLSIGGRKSQPGVTIRVQR